MNNRAQIRQNSFFLVGTQRKPVQYQQIGTVPGHQPCIQIFHGVFRRHARIPGKSGFIPHIKLRMRPLKQARRLADRIVFPQTVDTDLFLRHGRDIRIIDIPVQPRMIEKDQKLIVRQDRKAVERRLRIPQGADASFRQLLHDGTSEHMTVDSAAVCQIEHILLLFPRRCQQTVTVRAAAFKAARTVLYKIFQNRILFRQYPVFQIIQKHIVF